MKLNRLISTAILSGLFSLAIPIPSPAQTFDLKPNAVPNGVTSALGERYHQRLDITLGPTAVQYFRAFTITAVSELTVVTSSVTATSDNSGVVAFFAGTPQTNPDKLAFGITGTSLSGRTITVEFDVTTPTNFTGLMEGEAEDTAYVVEFASVTTQSNTNVEVFRHQNAPIRFISFDSPDSLVGATTDSSGRFFKLEFPGALPDLVHSGISGLSASAGFSEASTDILYSFFVLDDSTHITLPLGESPEQHFSLRPDGSGPLLGTRQIPRFIPGTFIRENYSATFDASAADSLNGVISISNTQDGSFVYVYVLADPAPDRNNYDPFTFGKLSGGTFLGRSGPLKVSHHPEFVVVGWDYDDDSGDDYDNTGVIQVPSDIIGMAAVDANRKDNRDITLDSGSFFAKGDAFSSVNGGLAPDPETSVDLLFLAQDADSTAGFAMSVFLSTLSGLGVGDLDVTGIDSLANAIQVGGTDSLTINSRIFNLRLASQDTIAEGDYYVYFVATDGDDDHRIVTQVQNDPFITSPTPARLRVKNSPNLTIDVFSLNDFDGSGDGDLDVVTGIDVSQMVTDVDGMNLSRGPETRFVSISWGQEGRDGDIDLDGDATIELYYSTRSDFNDVRGSAANTSGNSQGTDLEASRDQGNNDTHLIGQITEDLDGQFDNQFLWDLWSYSNAQGTVPATGVRYYLYALLKDGVNRLISLTEDNPSPSGPGTPMALNFLHPPTIRPVEPAADIMLGTIDEPVLVSWEASDVDNAEGAGLAVDPSGGGRSAPNNRSSSPNIRILLMSADFGEVTTWGSITNFAANDDRLWVGNSGDGSLVEEIELNEGVDSSFVIVGERMRNNLFNAYSNASSTGSLELQTGPTQYYVYLAIDDGRDGSVADAVDGSPLQTNFGNRSPVVRAPGRIRFTGAVPVNPASNARFVVPDKITTGVGQIIKYPIVIDDGTNPTGSVKKVNIFITVDDDKFQAIDQDLGKPGVQPFTLSDESEIIPIEFNQNAMLLGGKLRLDLEYTGLSGLTFFDGEKVLATAHLKPKPLGGPTMITTTISLDFDPPPISRETLMRDGNNVEIGVAPVPATSVDITERVTLLPTVPLQGRATTSSDTMTFFLREVGGFATVSDSLFELNDIDASLFGVQDTPKIGMEGIDQYELFDVPSGRWVLTASIPRHLNAKKVIEVEPGSVGGVPIPVSSFEDGDGNTLTELYAGDAAGFNDASGRNIPDNAIGAPDINAINNALYTTPSDSLYNTFADINRDTIVNATDKDFATTNTTSNTGAPGTIRPVFPSFKGAIPQERDNSQATYTLTDLPQGEVKAGETFDVTVKVSGAQAVRTYDVHLEYDQTKLAMEYLMSSGTLLENYLTNMSGKILKGEVGFVNSIIGRTPVGASGEGTLATIRFRTLARATEARLALSDGLLIDVDHVGAKPKLEGEAMIAISNDPIVYHDANGGEIRGLILPGVDSKVDFNDFLIVAKSFGSRLGDSAFDVRADLNGDDQVNFADFLIFTQDFGRVAIDAPAPRRLVKAASVPGVNRDAELSLNVDGKARIGKAITLSADLSQAEAVQGWGLTVRYDADRYEFVEAKSPEGDLLTSAGATAPLFLVHQEGPDQITLASAIGEGQAASGDGSLAVLTFRPKTSEFEDARFEIFEGVLFDSDHLTNPIHMNEALEVRLVPAEFALSQNYPNPFNPETTISYDLAEGSEVRLEIYNVMGQLVNTLVSEAQAAGRYRMRWSGQDAFGRQVASGVYFYRLQTEGFKAVRKLMLLK